LIIDAFSIPPMLLQTFILEMPYWHGLRIGKTRVWFENRTEAKGKNTLEDIDSTNGIGRKKITIAKSRPKIRRRQKNLRYVTGNSNEKRIGKYINSAITAQG